MRGKRREIDLAVYWHPLLAQFLRHDYAELFDIQSALKLGGMPLEADLGLIRKPEGVRVEPPFPFNHLGQCTIGEFKGPHDTANQDSLAQLEVYGILYQQQEGLQRRNVTLWLIASDFVEEINDSERAYLENLQEVGPGLYHGILDRFPTYLVNLGELPISAATLPLLMVYRGPREREIMEYLLDHRDEFFYYFVFAIMMHLEALQEVLAMRNLKLEELDLNAETLVNAAGEERVLSWIGEEKVIRLLGEEKILSDLVRMLGEERTLADLARMLGKERIQQLLDKLPSPQNGNQS